MIGYLCHGGSKAPVQSGLRSGAFAVGRPKTRREERKPLCKNAMAVKHLFNAATLSPDASRGYAHTRRTQHRHTPPAARGSDRRGHWSGAPRARVRPVKLHARALLAPGHYSLGVFPMVTGLLFAFSSTTLLNRNTQKERLPPFVKTLVRDSNALTPVLLHPPGPIKNAGPSAKGYCDPNAPGCALSRMSAARKRPGVGSAEPLLHLSS